MMQIKAAQRLSALLVREGDNFDDAKTNLKNLQSYKAADYEVLGNAGAYTVLRRVQGMGQWYILVDKFETTTKPLKSVATILGFMAVLRLPNVDEVFSVYVDPKMRGKGLGQTLYGIAHKEAKKGLQSSEDLGTLSLATWLSIYRREPKVCLLIKGKKVPRKDVVVDGLSIAYKGMPLIGPNTPNFNFFWK